MSNNYQVAETIRQQIGNRAFVMMGAKELVATETSLRFRIGQNSKRITHIHVTLTPDDLYTVEFWRKWNHGLDCVKVAEETGIFFDDLRKSFERNTGLYTSL